MSRPRFLLCGAFALTLACGDGPNLDPLAPPGPQPLISDAVHDLEGNEHFFWLPPMVGDPGAFSGDFDGTLSPSVEICELDGADCLAPLVATFTMTTGPGSETVRVSADDQHYIVNWHTDEFNLDDTKTYRIVAQVDGQELGYADVDVVNNGSQLKNVDTNEYIPLKDGRTLPIKFRIEEGAIVVDPCEPIAFADANLEAYVRQLVGIPTGPIAGAEVSGITYLNIGNQGVASIEGLQCFTGLTYFQAGAGNAIVDISPLADLTGLTFVGLRSNQVSDLGPLSGLTNLTSLDIAVLPITDLSPLAPLTNMVSITMFDDPGITDVTPLAGMTQLEYLYTRNSPLNGTETALAGMTEMVNLNLTNAGVTDLGFMTGMSKLQSVILRGNQITDLSPLTGLPALWQLWVDSNLLTDITPLGSMTGLTNLNLFDNPGITDITPLGNLTNLTFLWMRGFNVGAQTSVLQNLTLMDNLRIDTAGLTTLSFVSGMPLLTTLSVADNSISDASPVLGLANLQSLVINLNPTIDCSDAVLVQLVANGVSVIANFPGGGSGACT
jgi:internalin A